MTPEVPDCFNFLRTINVFLYVTAAWVYFVYVNYRFAGDSWGWRIRRCAWLFVLVLIAGASGDSYVRGNTVTVWTVGLTVAGVGVLVGLWMTRACHRYRCPGH